MKFFIDTAENLMRLKRRMLLVLSMVLLLNPSLIVKAKRDLKQVISEIANLVGAL